MAIIEMNADDELGDGKEDTTSSLPGCASMRTLSYGNSVNVAGVCSKMEDGGRADTCQRASNSIFFTFMVLMAESVGHSGH